MIEGVLCEGRRTTVTWPVGSALGNDRPISAVSELWTSAELHVTILSKSNDPRTGEQTRRLIHLSRAEPSAELFQPPSDYAVTDGTAAAVNRGTMSFVAPTLACEGQAPVSAAQGTVGGAYRIGGDVSAPALVSKVEPEYSEEARQAKYSGSVLLSVVVDENGVPQNIKVVRPLGMGLDQKAIEAVMKWRFRPGMKGGKAVPVMAQIEVSFRI